MNFYRKLIHEQESIFENRETFFFLYCEEEKLKWKEQ